MTRLLVLSFALAAAVLTTSAPTATAEGPRTISFAEAVELAAGDSLAVAVGRDQIEAARAKARSTRAQRLPTLGVKGNVLAWNDVLSFSQACSDPDPAICPSPVVTATIRGRVTASAEVNIVQPISQQAILGHAIKGDQAAIDLAQAQVQIAKLDAAYQAAEAYLGALQAQTLRELAATSVAQLEADLVRIRALRDAHVLADVDVLRLEAARDQAQAGVLEAEAGTETALRGLALLLSLPDGTQLALAPLDTTPPEVGWTEDGAVAAAGSGRAERQAAAARVTQAEVGAAAARTSYYPSVVAIANYTRTEGQGFIASKNSAYVGVSLDWSLWDWGKRGEDVAAARAGARMAHRLQDELDDQLAFDVRTKWLAATTKQKTLAVHDSALRAAEEAYRLQAARITAGLATATDVIDAEAEVTRARAQATVARYQYLISWMALVRAVGQVPAMPGAK